MNITEYRQMKAEEAQQPQEQQQQDSQVQVREEQPNVQAQSAAVENHEQTNQTQEQASSVPTTEGQQNQAPAEPNPTETNVPQVVEIEGRQVPIEELKNGYLRQSDYTKKTQDLAKERQQAQLAQEYYKAVNANPELAQQLSQQYNLPYVDPAQAEYMDLNTKYQDLLLEREVEDLKQRYDDFDVKGVLELAMEKQMENLEDAYFLYNSRKQASTPATEQIDVNALKEQLRQELLSELQSNVDTSSIIQSGGDTRTVQDTAPILSPQEQKVARAMKIPDAEYAKWKNRR